MCDVLYLNCVLCYYSKTALLAKLFIKNREKLPIIDPISKSKLVLDCLQIYKATLV